MKNAITIANFHLNTVANFTKIDSAPSRKPDFRSDSGSMYWYEGGTVIRESNHWGASIASCAWFLENKWCSEWGVGECNVNDFIYAGGDIETAPPRLWSAFESEGARFIYEVSNDMRLYVA